MKTIAYGEWDNLFKSTPKPRDLTEEEYRVCLHTDFNKTSYKIEPAWECTDNVWAAANDGKLPVYRFYDLGTNSLKVLKYSFDDDEWKEIQLESIKNLYGIIWKVIASGSKYMEFDCGNLPRSR
jgi:hypothetical protein